MKSFNISTRAPPAMLWHKRRDIIIPKIKKQERRCQAIIFRDVQNHSCFILGVPSDFRLKIQNNREKICLTR
jgi:hypothetical protein